MYFIFYVTHRRLQYYRYLITAEENSKYDFCTFHVYYYTDINHYDKINI